MMITEERLYAGVTWKIARAAKGIGNRVMTKIDNAGLKAGDAVLRKRPGPAFKFKPKTTQQLNRETIQLKNKVTQAKGQLYEAAMNPGGVVDKGIETAARNPITAASFVGDKITMVSGNPVLMATPVGALGAGAEKVVKKKIPAYARLTDRLGNSYAGSPRLRGAIVNGTNSALTGLRTMMI